MAICRFCQQRFRSEQGVKAHMRKCDLYQTDKREKAAALGSLPKATATPVATAPAHAIPPVGAPDLSAPLREFMKVMSEAATKQHAPQTPQQQRRSILQAAKERIIDRYRPSSGVVTSLMRGTAKARIEHELATLPLEELPFDEVCEFVIAIRDRCYAPTLTRQAQEAEHQNAEHEARHRKQIEEMAAGHRTDRRKSTLIEQAIGQARARCEAKRIIGPHRLSLLVDIELRLTEFLTGSEPVPDAHAIIQTVLDARFAEAEAKQDAARAKKDARWRDEMIALLVLGALVGLVVLALKFPARTLAILNWIERTFGFAPGAEAGTSKSDASETTPPAAGAEARPPSRRWRKDPVPPSSLESPWAHSVGPEGGHA